MAPVRGSGAVIDPLRRAVGDTWKDNNQEVNENHKVCGSDEWRAHIREEVLPWALGDRKLGDDVLEVGPGYGATTDVLCERAARLTAVEIDPELVQLLRADSTITTEL
jgi:protein-L-isoaspartate O-methyltransferase